MSDTARDTPSAVAAKSMGCTHETIRRWINAGAPYALGRNRQNQECFLVNVNELREWRSHNRPSTRRPKAALPDDAVSLVDGAKALGISETRLRQLITAHGAPCYYKFPDKTGFKARRCAMVVVDEISAWRAGRGARPDDIPTEAIKATLAAKKLGITKWSIYRWASRCKGFPSYGGYPLYVIVEEVEFWLRRRDLSRCGDCNTWFSYPYTTGTRRERCPPCRARRKDQRDNASCASQRRRRRGEANITCRRCKRQIAPASITNLAVKYHPACKALQRRQADRARRARPRESWPPQTCDICSELIPLAERKTRTQKRHSSCRKDAARLRKARWAKEQKRVESTPVEPVEEENHSGPEERHRLRLHELGRPDA